MELFQKYSNAAKRQSLINDPGKRIVVNKKFSFLLSKGELFKKFTPAEVFNYYTGRGGLHGLKLEDFNSFHDYTEAKKEKEQGAFFTPDLFLQKIHNMIKIEKSHFVADLSFGKGGFFNYCPNENNIFGCELDSLSANIGISLFNKGNLQQGDLRLFNPDVKMDMVFGNPPFNLRWSYKNENRKLSQMIYLLKSSEVLKEGGLLVLLVPQSFLIDDFMERTDMELADFHFDLLAQVKLDKQLFKDAGVEAFDTKLMFFKKNTAKSDEIQSEDKLAKLYNIAERKERNNDYTQFVEVHDDDLFYETTIKPVMSKLKSAAMQFVNATGSDKEGFSFKVKKLLFDLKRHTVTNEYHPKCLAYYNKFVTQKCPSDMKYEEWAKKHKISEKMVITYLKRYLKKRNPQKVHKKGDIVKTAYAIHEYKSAVSKETHKINDIVWYDQQHLEVAQPYLRLLRKKRKAFELQATPFDDMKLDPKIQRFLKTVSLVNDDMEPVKLNDVQLADTNKVLQKHSAYNQWDMGTGKTLTGMAQIKYRLKEKQIDKVFVIGPSISIDGTWDDALRKNDIRAINIKSLADLNRSMEVGNDVVMLSHHYIGKYHKQLKKFMKQHKVFLLVDEADEYSNPSSIRTKRVLSIFRRVKYKTLMSGTSVRNNIVEFYPQLELLYNNSILMMDECRLHYKINTNAKVAEVGAVLSSPNANRYKPFPAFRGFGMYKSAFNPSKVTVFGVKKQNQEIFNHEILSSMLDYTIITRSFKEVTGRDIHTIHQDIIDSNSQENALQEKIKEGIREFYGRHINSTGNDRKDAMLRLLHQMNLLFKSCAIPTAFDEYTFNTSSKYEHAKSYLDNTDKHIALGGMHIEEMLVYKRWIERDYPEKTIFYIDGSVNIKRRKQIIKEMKEVPNSVLISTIGALKSSLNINYIDKILAVSLPWNFSQLDQWQKRFVRYDSKNFKNIHYITLGGTIESNLIKLIVDKDSLVSFMKTKKLDSSTQLNVDLDMLLSMIVDKKELKKENEDKAA